MKPLTAREMSALLNVRGWTLIRQCGSHMVFKHPVSGKVVVVPNHPGRALSTGTQRRIMRDAGITHDDL